MKHRLLYHLTHRSIPIHHQNCSKKRKVLETTKWYKTSAWHRWRTSGRSIIGPNLLAGLSSKRLVARPVSRSFLRIDGLRTSNIPVFLLRETSTEAALLAKSSTWSLVGAIGTSNESTTSVGTSVGKVTGPLRSKNATFARRRGSACCSLCQSHCV